VPSEQTHLVSFYICCLCYLMLVIIKKIYLISSYLSVECQSDTWRETWSGPQLTLPVPASFSQQVNRSFQQAINKGGTTLYYWQQQKSLIWCDSCKKMNELEIEMHYIAFLVACACAAYSYVCEPQRRPRRYILPSS
jgi:hypothetical protein